MARAQRIDESHPSRENRQVASLQHVGLWRSLGARFHGMEEVIGSIPIRSTKQPLQNQANVGSGAPLPSMTLCHFVSRARKACADCSQLLRLQPVLSIFSGSACSIFSARIDGVDGRLDTR